MSRKILMVSALAALNFSIAAPAEESRAFLTTENKFPEQGQLELSYLLESDQNDGFDYATHALQARYGLIENLTTRLTVPYAVLDPEVGDSVDGLGDVRLGFDLLAFEDIFRYPYVIPHVEVGFATDGKTGLLMAAKGNPDLILLDICMPKMNGIEILKILKSTYPLSEIPVIMLSGLQDDSIKKECFYQYDEEYIEKPVEIAQLNARIEAVLRRCGKLPPLAAALA